MARGNLIRSLVSVAAGLAMGAGVAVSQPSVAQEDAPGRGVARLSLIAGDVAVKRGDTGESVAAAVNGPLVVQDRVLTGHASRAEVQFDFANLIRLSSQTDVRLSELETARYQIQVGRGLATFVALDQSSADIDIATPSVSVRPLKRGVYRIEVRDEPGGPITEIAVRAGEAEVFSPKGTQRLRAGRTMLVRGALSDPEFQPVADSPDDDWDRWNERRNREMLRSASYNYMSRDIYGGHDLDAHGSWVQAPQYGWVWTPRVAPGWAPYRFGRWNWLDYYGWNWISYDPWGWAPYHYGRWFQWNNRWCWWPGAIGARQWWRPALVAWVGFGGVGVGVSFGGGWGWNRLGWIPLAPFEPFYPWYGRGWYGGGWGGNWGRGSFNRTTIVNNINVTNIYRNARIDNATTVVDAARFGRGGVENLGVRARDLERVAQAQGPLPIVPDRASTRMADRELRAGAVSESGREQFFSRRQAAPVERVSFDDQRRNFEQVARATFGDRNEAARGGSTSVDGGRGGDGFGRADNGRRDEATSGRESFGRESARDGASREAGGWRRMGEASRDAGGRDVRDNPGRESFGTRDAGSRDNPARDSGGRDNGGWRRFGDPRGYGERDSAYRDSGSATREDSGRGNGRGGRQDGWLPMNDRSGAADGGRGESSRRDGGFGDRGRSSVGEFGGLGRDSGGDRATDRGGVDRGSFSRGDRGETGIDRGSDRGFGGFGRESEMRGRGESRGMDRGEPVRVNPPMIEDRGGFGRGGMSPRMESPRGGWGDFGRGSAPRMESPRDGGGFGGGGSPRMEGPRGDGGGRSGGGDGASRGSGGGGRSGGGRGN